MASVTYYAFQKIPPVANLFAMHGGIIRTRAFTDAVRDRLRIAQEAIGRVRGLDGPISNEEMAQLCRIKANTYTNVVGSTRRGFHPEYADALFRNTGINANWVYHGVLVGVPEEYAQHIRMAVARGGPLKPWPLTRKRRKRAKGKPKH